MTAGRSANRTWPGVWDELVLRPPAAGRGHRGRRAPIRTPRTRFFRRGRPALRLPDFRYRAVARAGSSRTRSARCSRPGPSGEVGAVRRRGRRARVGRRVRRVGGRRARPPWAFSPWFASQVSQLSPDDLLRPVRLAGLWTQRVVDTPGGASRHHRVAPIADRGPGAEGFASVVIVAVTALCLSLAACGSSPAGDSTVPHSRPVSSVTSSTPSTQGVARGGRLLFPERSARRALRQPTTGGWTRCSRCRHTRPGRGSAGAAGRRVCAPGRPVLPVMEMIVTVATRHRVPAGCYSHPIADGERGPLPRRRPRPPPVLVLDVQPDSARFLPRYSGGSGF